MPPSISAREEAVFQSVVPQLEAEGYAVFVQPSNDMLPAFLSGFHPDAVAYKENRKIAIEVVSQTQADGPKVQRIQRIFSDHPDWELRVIYAPVKDADGVIPALPEQVIEEYLHRIEKSYDAIGGSAALLTARSAFEAAARRLMPGSFETSQSPSDLIEALASDGSITPDEADMLRRLSRIRNNVAHGQLDLQPGRADVDRLIQVVRGILGLGR